MSPAPNRTRTEPTHSARSRCRPSATGARRRSARSQNFRIGGERMPVPLVRALGLVKQAAALVNKDLGELEPAPRRRDRPCRCRGRRRQVRRRVPARRLADRLRHAVEHERQRGDRGARERDARRQARRQIAGASERSRQPRPVLERLVPDRDAHRRGARDRGAAAPGVAAPAPRARREGARPSPTWSRSAARISRTRPR